MSKLLVWFLFLFLSLAGLKTSAHLPFLWQSGAACGCADLFVTRVCVCVRVMCHHVCVCVCVRCVRGACAVCVRVWWQSGAACGRADLFATRVRVMCHHGCVCSVWCVVCVCVCARALPLCCGSLVLHAALRTYLSLMCVCVCACAVPPRACVCGGGGGAVCVCARVGPLLWQSGTACGCADLFATRSCV